MFFFFFCYSSITTEQFEGYANLIASLFPSEVTETYYIPAYYKNKKRILTTGRLWHCYNNTKGRLRSDYLLERKIISNENIPNKKAINYGNYIEFAIFRIYVFKFILNQ